MKVIWFNGNLGNQVFYCAFKDYLLQKDKREKIYYYYNKRCPKIVVDKCFELTLPQYNRLISFFSCFIFEFVGFLLRHSPIEFTPHWYCDNRKYKEGALFFENYLQDNLFYKNKSSDWLRIKLPDVFPERYAYFEQMITTTDSVCIHLRRGDYVAIGSEYEDLSGTDYYEKAIMKAKEWYPHATFFFFSDDLDYVKNKFKGDNYYYVDCNRGANSYLDMDLMSRAKVTIMANSTFSYWAAYMFYENKKVIYPLKWFKESTGRICPNIMMDSWIGM